MLKRADLPLTAIRALVAIGRHGNFTRAAAALGITQSAVSRHVATLEAMADCRLFERKGPTIAFTPTGSQFYETVKDAISTLELSVQQMSQRGRTHGRLMVRTSMPSFALTVLVPALGLRNERGLAEVDFITSLSPPQPQDEFDVLITRDLGLPSAESWELIQEELVCVGSPALVAQHRVHAVHPWPMIAVKSRPDVIPTWALAHNLEPNRLHVSAMHDHLFLAVAAAIGGMGLLVVPRLLVLDPMRQGTLVLVSDQVVASGAVYWAYVHPQSKHVQAAREFCRWLKGMLRARTAELAGQGDSP